MARKETDICDHEVGSRGPKTGRASLLLGVYREAHSTRGIEGGPEWALQSPGEGQRAGIAEKLAGWPQPGSDPRRKEVSEGLAFGGWWGMCVEARWWDVKEKTCGEEAVALNPHLLVTVFIRESKEHKEGASWA